MGQAILMGQRGSRMKMVIGTVSFSCTGANIGGKPVKTATLQGFNFTPKGCIMLRHSSQSTYGLALLVWQDQITGTMLDNTNRSAGFVFGSVYSKSGNLYPGATIVQSNGSLYIDLTPTANTCFVDAEAWVSTIVSTTYNYIIWGE